MSLKADPARSRFRPDAILTAPQMRALEQAAIASGIVTGLDLMERAGRGAIEAALVEWPRLASAPGRALILCGPGNNGGDGFVVARLLRQRGWDVVALLLGDAERLPPDARVNCNRWREMGQVKGMEDASPRDCSPQDFDLVVDAIFGTGLIRPFTPPATVSKLLRRCRTDRVRPAGPAARPPVLALDTPSGLDADSGRVLAASGEGDWVDADLTVAFHTAKPGHFLADGPFVCGNLRIVDLGLREDVDTDAAAVLRRVTAPVTDGFGMLAVASGDKTSPATATHKYDHGHALVLAGGFGRTGAARLSARGALRIGAGLVTVAAPGSAIMECAAQLTAIMLRRCDDADGLADLLEDVRINALCLGPGLGTGEREAGLVEAALAAERATVLDADALTILSRRQDPFGGLHDGCVLTPHSGEFARLFPDIAGRLDAPAMAGPAYSKIDATRDAAKRAGCTILFKGPDTVIAGPSGAARLHAAAYDRAAPWLATAGTGDVLAGMVTGLLARGLAPMDAAACGTWCHVEAARGFGPGLIAEDLPERLPAVLSSLAAR